MIKKLQIRFITLSAAAVLIVMSAAIGLFNVSNFMVQERRIDEVLDILTENDGVIPEGVTQLQKLNELGEEYRYQIRYFSGLVSDDGSMRSINVDSIAAVDLEEAEALIKTAYDRAKPNGKIRNPGTGNTYAYKRTKSKDGTLVVVYDCTASVLSMLESLRSSVVFGFLCLIGFMAVMTLLSKRALATVIHSIESQRQFVTNAGHELKTPLTIISANVDVMEMTDGKTEWTESTRRQVTRLTELIDRLIRMARIGEKDNLNIVDVNLTELVTGAANSFRTVAEQVGKTLSQSVDEGIVIKADREILTEVANVLIDNACKYCDDGGRIDVVLKKDRKPRLSVTNDYTAGMGVDYSKFFDRFYREDTSHNSEKQGFGIGLSMAGDAVRAMNGRIDIAYRDGRITFTIIL